MSAAGQSLELGSIASPVRNWRPTVRQDTAKWVSPALVFVLAAGSTFAIVLFRESTPDFTPVTALHRTSLSSDLGLKVDSEGNRLVLRWNRQNPLMRFAGGASLLIQDGSQQRTIRLDAGQLGDGSVAYKPVSNDVTFRLEVSGPEGPRSASMRVLDGTSRTTSK